jgi:hypothetical protein
LEPHSWGYIKIRKYTQNIQDLWDTIKKPNHVRCLWFKPINVTIQEAEIRRFVVWSQPKKIVHETLSWKNPSQKRAGGVAEGVGPEFKPHYWKKKKNCESWA